MNEMRKLMEAIEQIVDEDFNSLQQRQSRQATRDIHIMMDEGILDPRKVADACLDYMSEAEVKDMAESEGFLFFDESEDFGLH